MTVQLSPSQACGIKSHLDNGRYKKKMLVFLPCGIDHCYEMNPWINSVGHLQGAFRISLVGSGNSEEAIHCLYLVPLILKDHAPVYNINHLIHHY